MPATWKTVRVFISSTFRDMQAERDHLVRFVFPRLREELLRRRIHLVDVDLRWGVTSEQDASAVCREVIDECRPRFLCMLGGRYGTIPEGRDLSITADEVHFGVLDERRAKVYALFYFRHGAVTETMDQSHPGSIREPRQSEKAGKLASLKRNVRKTKHRPFLYRPRWSSSEQRLLDLQGFGDRVACDILATIDDEFGAQSPAQLDEFTEENAAMESFVEERTQRFVLGSRETVWSELLQHAAGTGGNGYLCLVGEPGSGKSALLAKFFQHLSSPPSGNPLSAIANSKLVIAHFIGASPGSTDGHHTLRRLCHELTAGAEVTAVVPDDPEKLRAAFPEILKQACAKTRVVLLLDAVNQFDLGSSDLSWLPEELPDNARVIVSTLAGSTLDYLRRRANPPREITLPPLSPDDADAIINEFLHRYRKSMTTDQRAMLRTKTEAITPLYLLAALEELRTLGTYEEITSRIRELPETTQALFSWILKRLENDLGFRDAEGRLMGANLVGGFSAFLAASQHGLSQSELVDLLDRGDPQGNVAALLQLLRPYLMRRGKLLDFYHGQFRSAAERQYLQTNTQRDAAHVRLAAYFHRLADPGNNQRWEGEDARPFVELPFHLARSDEVRLRELLWNPHWYRAKLTHANVYGLINDLGMIPQERELRLVQDAVYLSAPVLTRDPTQLASQLVGRLLAREEPRVRVLATAISVTQHRPWLRPLAPSLAPPGGPLLRTLEGHAGEVLAVAVTTDGKAVSGSADNTLKIWDLASGRFLRTLEGHTSEVRAVAVTADGLAVSGSADKTLKIWDLASGMLLRTLNDHKAEVNAVAVTTDGKAVSGSADNTLKVWDLASGTLVRTLEGHTDEVRAVAVTADGKAVSGSGNLYGRNVYGNGSRDTTLKVWDIASGRLLRTLEGPASDVHAVAVTVDGKAVSADKTLKVWDVASGQLLRTLEDRTIYDVSAVAVTADGKAVSGTGDIYGKGKHVDKTLKVWDIATGRLLRTLEGHADGVRAVAVTADGKVVSGSADKTLKIWDLNSDRSPSVPKGHADVVFAVAVTAAYAVSGSLDQKLKVWDVASGRLLHALEGHAGEILRVAVTTDGKAISGSCDQTLKVWEIAAGRLLCTLEGHFSAIFTVVATADGKAVSGSGDIYGKPSDNTLKVWDIAAGRLVHTLEGHTDRVYAVAVTTDGKAVSGSGDHKLKVWDIASGRLLRTLEGHTAYVSAVATTADGKAISGSGDHTLKVWDLASGRQLYTFEGHDGEIRALAVAADNRVVSASGDNTLKVWDLTSGKLLLTLEGHTDHVNAVAITADGKAVSAAEDNTLKVWDLASGKLLTSFTSEAGMNDCGVTPDGHTIVAGDESGHVHFLRLEGL